MIYNNREERAKYIVWQYGDYLKGRILDVGCWEKDLKKYLENGVEYFGIDIAGKPDQFVDLEEGKLSFKANSFDCVVCADVLEHLDSFHKIFDELIRVSKKYVIISLPNCYHADFKRIIKGEGNLKYYGLPIEKPLDRHKWFFTYSDTINFVQERANKNNVKIFRIDTARKSKSLRDFIFRIFLNEMKFKNIFYPHIWVLLKK